MFLSWKGQHFVSTGIDTLEMDFPHFHIVPLPKPPSMDLYHHVFDQEINFTANEMCPCPLHSPHNDDYLFHLIHQVPYHPEAAAWIEQ